METLANAYEYEDVLVNYSSLLGEKVANKKLSSKKGDALIKTLMRWADNYYDKLDNEFDEVI